MVAHNQVTRGALKSSPWTGTPIPINDIWIAAQTKEVGAELVAYDAHFGKVAGLVRWREGNT
jgi:predicted nucleic acid-binding protein